MFPLSVPIAAGNTSLDWLAPAGRPAGRAGGVENGLSEFGRLLAGLSRGGEEEGGRAAEERTAEPWRAAEREPEAAWAAAAHYPERRDSLPDGQGAGGEGSASPGSRAERSGAAGAWERADEGQAAAALSTGNLVKESAQTDGRRPGEGPSRRAAAQNPSDEKPAARGTAAAGAAGNAAAEAAGGVAARKPAGREAAGRGSASRQPGAADGPETARGTDAFRAARAALSAGTLPSLAVQAAGVQVAAEGGRKPASRAASRAGGERPAEALSAAARKAAGRAATADGEAAAAAGGRAAAARGGAVGREGRTTVTDLRRGKAGGARPAETAKSGRGRQAAEPGTPEAQPSGARAGSEPAASRLEGLLRAELSGSEGSFRPEAAQRAAGAAAGEAGGAQAPAFSDRVLPEIVRHTGIILRDGGSGEIRLVLEPEALGSVRIRIQIRGDERLEARILVDNPEAKALFEEHLDGLRDALQAEGFQAPQLSVSVGGERSGRGEDGQGPAGRPAADAVRELEQAVPLLADWVHADRLVNITV